MRIREESGNQSPVFLGMAADFQVRQLVDHNVFDEGWHQHDDAPVEAEGAVGGAAAPTLALVADEEFRRFR